VIGGGMTAIDIATQAKRLGAEEVTIVYRRGAEAMNASRYEQELAQTSGVLIRHWLRPVALESRNGAVIGITFEYTRLEGGRVAGTGERLTLACDQVFKAIGQKLDDTLEDLRHSRCGTAASASTANVAPRWRASGPAAIASRAGPISLSWRSRTASRRRSRSIAR
jgi:glutamate synthase (NADPH/NADH) small chain